MLGLNGTKKNADLWTGDAPFSHTAPVSHGHVSNPYPAEYSSFETDFATLERVALATGGRSDPKDWRQLFDPEGEQIKFDQELWPRAVMAAIGIYLLDLLLRRVRLFDRKFLPRRRKRKVLAA